MRADVRTHLESCPRCRHRIRQLAHAGDEPEPCMERDDRFRPGDTLPPTGRFESIDAFDMERGIRVCLKRIDGVPLDELRATASRLEDAGPHVVPFEVLDDGTLVRRFVDGRDGSAIGRAPRALQLRWLAQAAVTLARLHQTGVAHGALHERNLRIDRTRAVLLVDAGLCGTSGPGDFERDWHALARIFHDGPVPELTDQMLSPNPPGPARILAAIVEEQTALSSEMGRYSRTGSLGRGGMGEVYRVRDPKLDRPMALKALLPDLADSASARDRFMAEARITAQLEHPGVIPVHEMGELADGSPYFTMKQVAGQTFAAALRADEPGITMARKIDVLIRVAQTVAYAHSRGVIHRDLKPNNVMVGDFGEVLVLDWGLAKVIGATGIAESAVPSGGNTGGVGTPGYMSPEQRTGRGEIRPQTDVYSLGAILSEILGSEQGEPELKAIARKATDPDPARRYPDADSLAQELIRWRDGQLVHAYPYSALELLIRRIRPYSAPLAVGALSAGVLVAFGAIAGTQLSATQRIARESTAQALVEQAHLALGAGDRMLAEQFASRALALAERPEARGILARVGRAPYPVADWTSEATCSSLLVTGDGTVCGGAAVSHRGDGAVTWTAGAGRVWPGVDGTAVIERPGRADVIDLSTGSTLQSIPIDAELVGVAPAAGELVLATTDRLWVAGDTPVDLKPYSTPIGAVIPCGPDRVLVQTLADVMQLWTPSGESRVLAVDVDEPTALACDEAGRRAALSVGSSIQLWDLDPSVQIGNLKGHDGRVTGLTWLGDRVVSASWDETVRVWSVRSPRRATETYRLNLEGPPRVAFSDGRLVTSDAAGLRSWTLPSTERTSSFDVMVGVGDIEWATDDQLVLVDHTGNWRRVDAATGMDVGTFPLRGIPLSRIATAAGGDRIYVGLETGEVVALDARGSVAWRRQVHDEAIAAVAWSRAQGRLAAAGVSGSIALVDATGTVRDHWSDGAGEPVKRLSYTADGSALLVVRAAGRLQQYDAEGTAREVGAHVHLAAASADGTTRVVQGRDGAIRVAGPASSTTLTLSLLDALQVSPDGRWFATSADRMVQIWSVEDGSEAARLVAHAHGATSLAFSDDGDTLATAGRDGQVVLWDLTPVSGDRLALLEAVSARYGTRPEGDL